MKQLLFLTLFTLVTSNQLFAQNIGRVVKLRGDAYKVNLQTKVKKRVKLGDFIQPKDQLLTIQETIVKVLMNDDTVLLIGPNSKFEFNKFHMRTKNDRDAEYNLNYGQLRSLFVHKAPKRTLKIKARNVAMGIRGTEILTNVYKDKHNQYQSDILLLSGNLDVTFDAPKIGSSTVNIKPGTQFSTFELIDQNSKDMKLGLSHAENRVMKMVQSQKDTFKSFLPVREKIRNQDNHKLEIQKLRDNFNNTLTNKLPKKRDQIFDANKITDKQNIPSDLAEDNKHKLRHKRKISRSPVRPRVQPPSPSVTATNDLTTVVAPPEERTLLPPPENAIIIKDPSLSTTVLPADDTVIVKDPSLSTSTTVLPPPPDDAVLLPPPDNTTTVKDPSLSTRTTVLPPPSEDSTIRLPPPDDSVLLPPPSDDSTLIKQ